MKNATAEPFSRAEWCRSAGDRVILPRAPVVLGVVVPLATAFLLLKLHVPVLFAFPFTILAVLAPRWCGRCGRSESFFDTVGAAPDDTLVQATYLTSPTTEQGRETYGVEDGAVAFVDGWLVFHGEASRWSVQACDVRLTTADDEVTLRVREGGEIRLRPYSRTGRAMIRADREFSALANAWARVVAEPRSGSILPLWRPRRGTSTFGCGRAVVWAVYGIVLGVLARGGYQAYFYARLSPSEFRGLLILGALVGASLAVEKRIP